MKARGEHCPVCGSRDVEGAVDTRECQACGHVWEEEGVILIPEEDKP